jgi:hypothetical protein
MQKRIRLVDKQAMEVRMEWCISFSLGVVVTRAVNQDIVFVIKLWNEGYIQGLALEVLSCKYFQ